MKAKENAFGSQNICQQNYKTNKMHDNSYQDTLQRQLTRGGMAKTFFAIKIGVENQSKNELGHGLKGQIAGFMKQKRGM